MSFNDRYTNGCPCHHQTFCPDQKLVGYENDVPVFEKKNVSPTGNEGHQTGEGESQNFLVISVDDDEMYFYKDIVPAVTEDEAIAIVESRRPYVASSITFTVEELEEKLRALKTTSAAQAMADLPVPETDDDLGDEEDE